MVPMLAVPMAIMGLIGSLLLGSMGLSNLNAMYNQRIVNEISIDWEHNPIKDTGFVIAIIKNGDYEYEYSVTEDIDNQEFFYPWVQIRDKDGNIVEDWQAPAAVPGDYIEYEEFYDSLDPIHKEAVDKLNDFFGRSYDDVYRDLKNILHKKEMANKGE